MPISIELETAKSQQATIKLSETWTAWQIIQTVFNIVNHILIIIVSVYMTWLTYNSINELGSSLKIWHSFLCTIGYQLLMTQSILAFYSQNLWSKQYSRSSKRTLHWVLQAAGSSIAILGMVLEFYGRWQKGKFHFVSTHSVLGLIAGIFTLIGMLNGVSALWARELKVYVRPLYLKLTHNLTGTAAFALGMASLFYGYDIKYMVQNSREDIRMWLQAFAIITTILTLIGALRALINHICNVFAK